MKRLGLAIIAAALFAGVAYPTEWELGSDHLGTISSIKPLPILSFTANGRTAEIHFEGPSVSYSGDMPIDDAAKLFFDHVMQHRKTWCESGKP